MKKYQGQLLQVKTNKEYSALLAEINGLKSKNTLIEDDIIELMESIERAKKAVKQAQDELARNKARVEENTLKLREEQQAFILGVFRVVVDADPLEDPVAELKN